MKPRERMTDKEVHTYSSNVLPAGKMVLTSECQIVEIGNKDLRLSADRPHSNIDEIFPASLPGSVDGVMIVYNAFSKKSFESVPLIIRE